VLLEAVLAIAGMAQATGDFRPGVRVFPELKLGDGISLRFVRAFSADRDVERKLHLGDIAGGPDRDSVRPSPKLDQLPTTSDSDVVIDSPHRVRAIHDRATLSQLTDVVTGILPGRELRMALPYRMAIDSKQRVIITDPPAHAIHIFDFRKRKYFRIQGGDGKRLQRPHAVAVDAADNIYVTDADLGMILVYDSGGNFLRFLGGTDGEGLFDRPEGIAIDGKTQHIFVSDSPRHLVFELDRDGNVLARFARPDGERVGFAVRGKENVGDIALTENELILADGTACVLRVFDRQGSFRRQIEILGNQCSLHPRSLGLDVDSDANFYISDSFMNSVYVYDHDGDFLFAFGCHGSARGELDGPSSVRISKGLIYIADSINHRVQVFELHTTQQRQHYPSIFKRLEPKDTAAQKNLPEDEKQTIAAH
jgi:DNA-binding beta-propeller fold protein YncE